MKKVSLLKKFLKEKVNSICIRTEDFEGKFAYKIDFETSDGKKNTIISTDKETMDVFIDYLKIKLYNEKIYNIDYNDNSFQVFTRDGLSLIVNENNEEKNLTDLENKKSLLSYLMKKGYSDYLEYYEEILNEDKIKVLNIYQIQDFGYMYDKSTKTFEYILLGNYPTDKYEINLLKTMMKEIVNKYGDENVLVEMDSFDNEKNNINSVRITVPRIIDRFNNEQSIYERKDESVIINIKGSTLISKIEKVLENLENKNVKKLELKGECK